MLTLKDFLHLPQLDTVVAELADDEPGLVVVAGLDPRPAAGTEVGAGFLPSGRATFFRILMREMLERSRPAAGISRPPIIVAPKGSVRLPHHLKRRADHLAVTPSRPAARRIAEAVEREPPLLVVDQLDPETAPAVAAAAQADIRVLTQMDTVFRGREVTRTLEAWGVDGDGLAHLRWVLAVERLPTLCPRCRRPSPPDPALEEQVRRRFPHLRPLPAGTYYRAAGCPDCHHSGYYGDVAVFDLYRAGPTESEDHALPAEDYLLHLAAAGHLPLQALLRLEDDRLRRTYQMLTASERALAQTNAALRSRLAELETANRVLQQRTEQLVSLQDLAQALSGSEDLGQTALRVCRHAAELCGADRVILYVLGEGEAAQILATHGWDLKRVAPQVDARSLPSADGSEPAPFRGWPPGIPPRAADVEGAALRGGLHVPLRAQEQPVGAMIVHSTKRPAFEPGEVALLQSFANQAAVALQREGLVETLREKVGALETAYEELAQTERMEREMELARQVQRRMLPRTVPQFAGYELAVRYQPARQVGGDFYDVIPLEDDLFGLAVADVTDKGMPAALYMALTRSLLLAEARRARSPRAVLESVNRLLLQLGQPDMFVTLFYGVVAGGRRRLTYARAGHDRPFLLRGGAARELHGDGMPLGLLPAERVGLSEEVVQLEAGDRLVLYSDGLTDTLSPTGELFGPPRLRDLLLEHADLRPAGLCAATFERLAAYRAGAERAHRAGAEQYDDMTLLVMAVDDPPPGGSDERS